MRSFAIIGLISTIFAIAAPTPRIVGGFDANQNQFPHQISLQQFGNHICGGSIIAESWVLTAAHCVDFGYSATVVVAGQTKLSEVGKIHVIDKVFIHENWGNFRNDIALIYLLEPLTFSESIQPIALRTTEVPDGSEIIISGWGRIFAWGPIPDNLKYNYMIKQNARVCERQTGLTNYNGLICFNSEVNNGACNGDSGGPATFEGELIGIASFVMGTCGTNQSDGYTKVSYFIDWINEHVNA